MAIFDATSIGQEIVAGQSSQGYTKLLETKGQFPKIEIVITPLSGSKFGNPNGNPDYIMRLTQFMQYSFSSSVLVPVDAFSFNIVTPQDPRPVDQFLKSGDIATLFGNEVQLSTGIVDVVDTQVETTQGESTSVNGRNLLSQLEDNTAVDANTNPIASVNYTVSQVVLKLLENTRIPRNLILRDAPTRPYLFGTEPGESRLSALQRYLNPLNCLFWGNADGRIIVGRPNMSQASKGRLILSKKDRFSNVVSMKVTRNSTKVPNVIVPLYTGQEVATANLARGQSFKNNIEDCARLLKLGHIVTRCLTVSSPSSTSPQDQSATNQIGVANQKQNRVAGQTLLQAVAKAELARENINTMQVQAIVPGHYNNMGEPYMIDTCYDVFFDRGNVAEKMYLYSVEYRGSANEGQRTVLNFCRIGTIVSDIRAS